MRNGGKKTKQWFFDAPWGKIAMISWGDMSDPPVLLCHGYVDSAATFIPLVERLPNSYHYVGFDLPGNGLSDPLPPGMLPSQIHMVEAMRIVVSRMNWSRFVFIGHSMAILIAGFYNAVYPHKISKMINIDPEPALAMYSTTSQISLWYIYLHDQYYSKFDRYTKSKPVHYTHDEAINAVVRTRNVTEEQAEILLSRSLIPVGDGKYKLSWDPKMKKITNISIPKETLIAIFTTNAPLTLSIHSDQNQSAGPGKKFSEEVMKQIYMKCPNHFAVFAKGAHDLHVTNPEEVASHITEFLNREFNASVKSKL